MLRVRLNQEHGAVLGAIVESAIRQGHRAFRPALSTVALVPQDVAGLEVETNEGTTLIAAAGAIQAAIEEDHAAVVVFPAIRHDILDYSVRELDTYGKDRERTWQA